MARRMRHVCFAMSLQCEWRINHVFPLSITEVIDHKLSLLFSGTHGTYKSAIRSSTVKHECSSHLRVLRAYLVSLVTLSIGRSASI